MLEGQVALTIALTLPRLALKLDLVRLTSGGCVAVKVGKAPVNDRKREQPKD